MTATIAASAGAAIALFGVSKGWVKAPTAGLDERIDTIVRDSAQHFANEEALRRVTSESIADIDAALQRGGLVSRVKDPDKNEKHWFPLLPWWCGDVCERTEAECIKKTNRVIADIANIRGSATAERIANESRCVPAGIAYCGDAGCFSTLPLCRIVTKDPDKCLGVF